MAALLLAALLTLPASAQPAPAEPALVPAARTKAGALAPVAVAFETDPRIELLSVLILLAGPEPAGEAAPYALRARAAFSPFAGHAAVGWARAFLDKGSGNELTELFLDPSGPPEPASSFARAAGFDRFYKRNAAFYRGLSADAKAEAERGLRPDSVSGYLRMPDSGTHRFILAPLLPRELAANRRIGSGAEALFQRVRAANPGPGPARFSFDVFGAGSAHDVGHNLLDPLAAANRDAIAAVSGLMFDGCTGSWEGCVLEHVDVAVTLRALAAERGEPAYEEMLRVYARKYPYLEDLCRPLASWEAGFDGDFADFYPRLLEAFGEARARRVRASTPDAKPPHPRRPP